MSDLVERLRENPNYKHWLVIGEAADEIERLTASNAANADHARLATLHRDSSASALKSAKKRIAKLESERDKMKAILDEG